MTLSPDLQELLSSKSKATPGTDGLAPTAAEETSGAQQAEGDMVPISLWLGQGSQRLTPQPVTADSAAADSSDGTSKPESFSGSPEESPTLPFPREYEGNAEAQKASNSAAATASAPAAQSSDRESEFTVGGSDSAESSGREAREASNAHDAQRAPYNDFGQQGRAGMEEARQDRQAHTNGSSPSTLNGMQCSLIHPSSNFAPHLQQVCHRLTLISFVVCNVHCLHVRPAGELCFIDVGTNMGVIECMN